MMFISSKEDLHIDFYEFPILIIFATLGMMVMVSSNDLLSMFIGLELQSLSLYVLAALNRNSLLSSEAGIKYFILGLILFIIILTRHSKISTINLAQMEGWQSGNAADC